MSLSTSFNLTQSLQQILKSRFVLRVTLQCRAPVHLTDFTICMSLFLTDLWYRNKSSIMKLSTVLFVATQMTLVLSLHIARHENSDRPDDGPGSISVAEADPGKKLFARACWYGRNYGCSKAKDDNYRCWQKCGNPGEWCWLATFRGSGPWVTCGNDEDCSPQRLSSARVGCGRACSDCGCSC